MKQTWQTYYISGNYPHIICREGNYYFKSIDELLEHTKHLNDEPEQVIEYIEQLLELNYTIIGDYRIELVKGEIRETKKSLKVDLKRYKKYQQEWEE
jgi:hypothetical protein